MYKHYFKRSLDFVLALIILLLTSPVIVILTFILSIANNGKPFFFQVRPGLNGRLFEIVKFRTMNDKKDENGNLLRDSKRLTRVGGLIRKTSLDELPQLWNVLIGDMSLIGPRPLLPEYLPHYTAQHKRRHSVRPGITGLAQVNGRNTMKFSERFNQDVLYVENLSFKLDVKIIILTLKSVIFKSSTIVNGQTVDEVDDLGISRNLDVNHFKNNVQDLDS